MLEFSNLSPAQKKWVRLVELHHPEVKDTVTFAQIKQFHEEFKQLRSVDKSYKVSMPLWIITANAIRRGVYFFPGTENAVDPEPADEPMEIIPELEVEYQKELQNFGIA
jgi:hypothetical protein